ncbi:MAG: enoyl-CoA hydratase-related protein, partial [Dehalococcoidia bacterium]|nr:enoyl-CoA hydratase-related protein [Dehalococcoidia bacterium]
IIGKGRALEICLTGDMIAADEALRIGLINRIVAEGSVVDAARELAKKIAAKGSVAVQMVLHSVNTGLDRSLTDGLAVEVVDFVKVVQTEDARDGLTAFLESRPPVFKGR